MNRTRAFLRDELGLPAVYPAGQHLEPTVVTLARERVRRAEIGLGILRRYHPDAVPSPRGPGSTPSG